MFIKKLSHIHKVKKHREGSCFAVLGYPRSGTTMLSEIVSMVSDYYFDRDNIFPSSSRVVLHTHWDPERFLQERSICIIRNPKDVALSVFEYAQVRGLAIEPEEALSSTKICKLTWLQHTQKARAANHHLIAYDALVTCQTPALERMSDHLGIEAEWIFDAVALLGKKHQNKPHSTDIKFKAKKEESRHQSRERLKAFLEQEKRPELDLYQDVFHGG